MQRAITVCCIAFVGCAAPEIGGTGPSTDPFGNPETGDVPPATGGSTSSGGVSSTTDSSSGEHGSSGGSEASTGAPTSDGETSSTGSSSTGDGIAFVPFPCDELRPHFDDTEPNDTPEQAVDACTVLSGYWGNLPFGSTIGGDDDVDYISFHARDYPGDVTVPVIPCWAGGLNLLDVYIYAVFGGEVDLNDPLWWSETDATDCEGGMVMLPNDQDYLLEIRLAESSAPQTAYGWGTGEVPPY